MISGERRGIRGGRDGGIMPLRIRRIGRIWSGDFVYISCPAWEYYL
jgi:hypothetical protein